MVIAMVLAALPLCSAAEEPSLQDVLARAAHYVTTFHQQLSGIVAEEIYVQEVYPLQTGLRALARRRTQTLVSDFLLVFSERERRYVEFRDVFEVNRTPIRDRDERLTTLFISPGNSVDQIRAIVEESARHNIGEVRRNINTPLLTLSFLQGETQERFRFRRTRSQGPALANNVAAPRSKPGVFRVTTEMWVVDYRETVRPTFIKTATGSDFPARGRFWLNPETGAVLMSELVMQNADVRATINVSYQSEPVVGLLVPAEMRERYLGRFERVEGVATYGRFRQFQVKTDAILTRPPGGAR